MQLLLIPLFASFSIGARPDASVSLWLRCEPLPNVVVRLGKEAGLQLRVEDRLAGRKAALFVKDRPASEVMGMLATAFLADWRQTGEGLTLVEKPALAREEDDAGASETAASRERLARLMSTASDLGRVFPKAAALEASRVAWTLSCTGDVEARDQAIRRGEQLKLARFPCIGAAVSDAGMAGGDLASGAIVCVPLTSSGAEAEGGPDRILGFSMARYLPGCDALQCRDAPFGGTEAGAPISIGLWAAKGRSGGGALVESMSAWAKVLDPGVPRKILGRTEVLPKTNGSTSESTLDRLEWLSKASGVPVVADSFRLFVPCAVPTTVSRVGDLLEALRSPNDRRVGGRGGFVRTDRGWLLYRHPEFWDLSEQDPPEPSVRKLERDFSRSGVLAVEEYAEFASGLTQRQADAFRGRLPMRVSFPTAPLESAVSFLSLWRAFTPEQRRAAFGGGLRFQGHERRSVALRRTLSDFLWEAPSTNEAACEEISAVGRLEEPAGLRCRAFTSNEQSWARIEVVLGGGNVVGFDMAFPGSAPGTTETKRLSSLLRKGGVAR